MEGIAFLLLLFVGFLIITPLRALAIAGGARRRMDQLDASLLKIQASNKEIDTKLEDRIARLEQRFHWNTAEPAAPAAREPDLSSESPAGLRDQSRPWETPVAVRTEHQHVIPAVPAPAATVPAAPGMPPLPAAGPVGRKPELDPLQAAPAAKASAAPAVPAAPPVVKSPPAISLEQFMGVKLFAWVGGLALFLGLVLFVKLSMERGWISRELRTAIGFAAGIALVTAGVRIQGKKAYTVLGQTLSATGIVVLYGMTYAAHATYHFPGFSEPPVAFALMTLISAAAFTLAVRLRAQVVAVLGMIGGFLTPILCSTGQDQPLALFGYIALLDLGVLAIARRTGWNYLATLAAGGTIILELNWHLPRVHAEGLTAEWVTAAVFLGFAALFASTLWRPGKERDHRDHHAAGSTLALCATAMAVAFHFLSDSDITGRPAFLYGYVFLINLIVMAAVWKHPSAGPAAALAGLVTFAHLAVWTTVRLTPEMLPAALAAYLIFGLLHTGYGALWQRKQSVRPSIQAVWVPVVTLLLLLVPVLRLEAVTLLIWPAILLVDLGIIGLALLTREVRPVLAALVLTGVTTLAWLFKLPSSSPADVTLFLSVLGGFAIVFALASSVLSRRLKDAGTSSSSTDAGIVDWLPVLSAVLPFVLLILAMLQLQVVNPSPVFGLALLLCLFLLGLAKLTRHADSPLPLAAFLCVLALEAVWHSRSFDQTQPVLPLAWYLGFYGLFAVYPHVFRRKLSERTIPWITSAAAGVGTFGLVFHLVKQSWPNEMMGLLPAAFAVPALLTLATIARRPPPGSPARLTQLAVFGGVSLFFITLIFPLQFEKQWLTVSWALEGAALCWLFRRVPHPGLRMAGAGLLAAAFVRLALNPAVFAYHVRGSVAILNWQLYAYGLTAAALFLAAWWLPSRRDASGCLPGRVDLPRLYTILGGILLFLLLNIEIADAFTPAGSTSIVFEFSGNFARDMTYSIAWGLFALGLLITGFITRSPQTRYGGIGLLAVTLLKLFLHDLAAIENIYRIGTLIAVALIALAASFLYQRFINRGDDSPTP